MATVIALDHSWPVETTAVGTFLQERSTQFEARFSRYRGLLHFIACRVLPNGEGVAEAIENCRARAFQNPLEFEQEGAFRSWLFRILIDEARVLLQKNSRTNGKADDP